MNLTITGYEIEVAHSYKDTMKRDDLKSFEMLLLDINLPDGNGLDLLHDLRISGCIAPVLFLSARTDEETVVKAMEIGAEDYLRKPFGLDELKARMKRVHKRNLNSDIVKKGLLEISSLQRTATYNKVPLSLGRREFDILFYLMKQSPNIISREQILEYLGCDLNVMDRTIDSHISKLRKKIKDASGKKIKIESVYGVGYKFVLDEK